MVRRKALGIRDMELREPAYRSPTPNPYVFALSVRQYPTTARGSYSQASHPEGVIYMSDRHRSPISIKNDDLIEKNTGRPMSVALEVR